MKSKIIKKDKITNEEEKDLYTLYSEYYDNIDYQSFIKDLNEKNLIIILSDENGRIVGFSTIQLTNDIFENQNILIIFSGDTIVHPDYWKYNLLAPTFGEFLLDMIEKNPHKAIYWYLISKGYRTYRLITSYFTQSFPVYKKATPSFIKRLIDYLSFKKFGNSYNPDSGIISFNGTKDYLKDDLCKIPDTKRNNKHIRFFIEKNPNYHRGDELACIAKIEMSNISPLGLKLLQKRMM